MSSEGGDTGDITVTDNAARSRFEISVGGEVVGFADYRSRPDRIVITHTVVDDAYRGRGLAAHLTRELLQRIADRGLHVTPLCPYTADYIRKHQQWLGIVDEAHLASVTTS